MYNLLLNVNGLNNYPYHNIHHNDSSEMDCRPISSCRHTGFLWKCTI